MAFSISYSQSWTLTAPGVESDTTTPTGTLDTGIKVTVYPNWYKYVTLDWVVPTSTGPCVYHVYGQYGTNQEYTRLTGSALTDPSFAVPGEPDPSKNRHVYYVVQAIPTNGDTPTYSLPNSLQYGVRTNLGLIASEIQRREYLLLSKFAGVKSFLFRRKTFGLRCHRCWSPSLEKVMDDHCEVCFGTSYEGGYQKALPLYIQYDPTTLGKELSFFGSMETNQIGGWTVSVPPVNPWDIIIRTGDWSCYHVVRINTTELQTNIVRQLMVLTQHSRAEVQNRLLAREADDSGSYLAELGGVFSGGRFPRSFITDTLSDDPSWTAPMERITLPQKYIV